MKEIFDEFFSTGVEILVMLLVIMILCSILSITLGLYVEVTRL